MTIEQTPATAGTAAPPPKKRHRIFMWFFLAVQAAFIVWIVMGAQSTPTQTDATMQAAADAGTAIGVGLIILFWAVVDVILGITYAVVRMARR